MRRYKGMPVISVDHFYEMVEIATNELLDERYGTREECRDAAEDYLIGIYPVEWL